MTKATESKRLKQIWDSLVNEAKNKKMVLVDRTSDVEPNDYYYPSEFIKEYPRNNWEKYRCIVRRVYLMDAEQYLQTQRDIIIIGMEDLEKSQRLFKDEWKE